MLNYIIHNLKNNVEKNKLNLYNIKYGGRMEKEFIRKFKVNKIPFELNEESAIKITQYYLTVRPDFEIRIKKYNGIYEGIYTESKIKQEGLYVYKNEFNITEEYFKMIEGCFIGDPIEKDHYIIPLNDLYIYLDVHKGKTLGLISAKIKFKNENDALEFEPLEWFDEEITNNLNYRSKYLAVETKKLINFNGKVKKIKN